MQTEDIVARRILRLKGADETWSDVITTIGRPSEASGGEWLCRCVITGLARREDYSIAGIDGFQAIELAVRFIGDRLKDSPEFREGRLYWDDSSRYD